MKRNVYWLLGIFLVFNTWLLKAQTINGFNFVCGGTVSTYVLIDNTCAAPVISANWVIGGGSTSSTGAAAQVAWNASGTTHGSINATYQCPQPSGPDITKAANGLNVDIFILAPPILLNHDPVAFDCGSRVMIFDQQFPYNSFNGGPHPPVTTKWSYPYCWDKESINGGGGARITTDQSGYGTVSVQVTDGTCNQTQTVSKSFTRNLIAPDYIFSANPLQSESRIGFIKAHGAVSVPASSNVIFTAGSFIDLEPEFTAEHGSEFTAQIGSGGGSCNPEFCSSTVFGKTGGSGQTFTEEISVQEHAISGTAPIKVFPNPFENVLHVDFNQAAGSYELLDISGRSVTAGKLKSEQNQIDLTMIKAGVYFIRIMDEHGAQLQISKVYK